MSSLSKSVDEKLVAIRQKQTEQAKVEQQVPLEETEGSAQPTEEPVKQVAEEAPKEQPKVEEKPEPTEKVEKKVEEKPWYAEDETEEKVEKKSEIDFSSLVGDLDLGEIKTKEDFKAKVSELKSKLKEYEEQPLTGIEDEFKEVIKAAKSGVNWKDYLANQLIDYSKVNPKALFEEQFWDEAETNPAFFVEGKFNEQLASEQLATITEYQKSFYGKQIANAKMSEQRQRQQELRAKAEAKLVQAEKSLGSAVKDLNELLPFESHGIKFDSKLSSDIYQGISSSKLTKKHFGVDYTTLVNSGADMKAITRTVVMAEYGEKMLKHKSQNSKTDGKKEVVAKLQNVQLNAPGSKVDPETPEDKKPVNPVNRLKEHYQQKVGL